MGMDGFTSSSSDPNRLGLSHKEAASYKKLRVAVANSIISHSKLGFGRRGFGEYSTFRVPFIDSELYEISNPVGSVTDWGYVVGYEAGGGSAALVPKYLGADVVRCLLEVYWRAVVRFRVFAITAVVIPLITIFLAVFARMSFLDRATNYLFIILAIALGFIFTLLAWDCNYDLDALLRRLGGITNVPTRGALHPISFFKKKRVSGVAAAGVVHLSPLGTVLGKGLVVLLMKHADSFKLGPLFRSYLGSTSEYLGVSPDGYLVVNNLSGEWCLSFGELLSVARSLDK